MRRFFSEVTDGIDEITLSKDDMNHILKVLRLGCGEKIVVCDGMGKDYLCELVNTDGNVAAKVLSAGPCLAEPKVKVTLFQGLPKADKMDLIIQKCVEIGVSEIVPVVTERSVVKLNGKEAAKVSRWRKIAESAAKQAGRGIIPHVGDIVGFKQGVGKLKKHENGIVAYEGERELSIKAYLNKKAYNNIPPLQLAIFIGPEGGFSDKEILDIKEAGITPVSLGKRILRTETAGMAALTAILYEFNDI